MKNRILCAAALVLSCTASSSRLLLVHAAPASGPSAQAGAGASPTPAPGAPPTSPTSDASSAGAAAEVTGIAGMVPAPGVASLLESGVPSVPPGLKARVAQYQNARAAGLADVSDDGAQLLVTTRFGSTNQLHLVEQPLGARTQLTFADEPVNSARFVSGDPQTIYYLQDAGGGEFYQVLRLDRRTGRSEMVTDGKSRHGSLSVSRDGRRLAWSGTGRNGKDTDVYLAEASSPRKARRVTEAEGTWAPVEFSPDGTQLLVSRDRSIADVDLHVLDVASGQLRQVTPREGRASVREAAFSADGKSLFVVTDRFSDYNQLYRIDLSKPEARPAPLSGSNWDVEGLAVSPSGGVVFALNEDGASKLFFLEQGRAARPLPLPANAVVGAMKFAKKRGDVLALALQTATAPADVYELSTRTGKLVRWTRSEIGGLDPSAFVDAQLVRYPSAGGFIVPAFLYAPRIAGAGGKVPVIVLWHGGPEGQSRPTFSTFVQLLAGELGFAVLLPNVRGSDGYGKAYLAADDGVKREQALADIGATLDFIGSRPGLDPSRVGIHGGSYGGYMTLATVAFYPRRVRAAVDVVGISSLPTFLEHTQAYRRDLRRAEYGDERDPAVRAVQERISPLGSVNKIEAELFVQQGHNDPRVPQSEAEQIVKAVRARGKDVWYLLGLNEGHGFQKKENRDYATAATALFFQQKLAAAVQ